MPSENFTLARTNCADDKMVEYDQDFSSPGVSEPIRLRESDNGVTFQLSGDASSFAAVVERCTRDPLKANPNWAPAEDEDWSGNLVLGTAPRCYTEPARGWWRLRVKAVAGGTLQLNIIGERA